jgi:hypothetical protein
MLKFIQKRKKLLENTDPNRIYVENVRSFFNLPYKAAKFFCEMAVKENYFRKKIGLECPNHNCKRIIKSINIDQEIEDHIRCSTCELNEEEKFVFNKEEINKIIFYQLNG